MPIAASPTVTSLCTAAMKQGGIPNPTTTQIAELAEDGLQNVKTQIWLKNRTDTVLHTRYYIIMTEGEGYLDTPADMDHEIYVDMYSGPEDYAGTVQEASDGGSEITLAEDFSAEEAAVQGRFIFLTGGSGSGQHRQIIAYDNTTKVATVNASWLSIPSTDTTYLITTQERRLTRKDEVSTVQSWALPNIGYPRYYTKTSVAPPIGNNPALRVFPAPDHSRYACIVTYQPNLTLLDESSTIFIKHLRERRALWMQGLKTEVMQRYDDDRYMQAFGIWQAMLTQYGTHNYNQMQAEGNR